MNSIETVKSVLKGRKSLLANRLLFIKSFKIDNAILSEIPRLISSIDDLAIVLLPIILAKPLLNFELNALTNLVTNYSKTTIEKTLSPSTAAKTESQAYKKTRSDRSFLGYIRFPLLLTTRFPLFCYVVDVISLLLHAVGIDFHIKGGFADLIDKIFINLLFGLYATRIKDYIFQQTLRRNSNVDAVRSDTIDELTSIGIWLIVSVLCVELLQLRAGVALGSIFALGSAGTASIVLALRSTFENLIGGLALKLQDKFRSDEMVSIPNVKTGAVANIKSDEQCKVEEIGYIFTKLRKSDNSLMSVPNHIFSQGEVINWSRTPYRRFQTNAVVSVDNMKQLQYLIKNLRSQLLEISKIEKVERDLLVAATGFKDNKVIIDVEVHIDSNNDIECSDIKTQIIEIINTCIIEKVQS